MATSILMASDHNTNLTLSEDHPHPHPHQHLQTTTRHDHQTARQSGSTSTARRKSSKGNESKKKQPQRGMGVAQLERLRLGDRWKKMTEIKSSPPSLPYTVIPTSFAHDPTSLTTVPLHFAKFGGFGNGVTGVGLNFNQQPFSIQRVGLFHGQGLVSDDKFEGNLYEVGNVNETSKELSSTPNLIKCYSDHCSVCHQKKRIVSGENLVLKESVKDMNAEVPSMTSSDFVGLNLGNRQNNKETNHDFGKKATFHANTYSVGNVDQGVGVVAVHRKGSSSGGGNGSVFVEYEFFPAGKVGRSDSCFESENEFVMMMKKKVSGSESSSSVAAAVMGGGGEDASCVTTTTNTTTGVVDASISIDLSLRLSY